MTQAEAKDYQWLSDERDKLQKELDSLKKLIASDSVYTLLRFGDKNPSYSGVDECEEERLYIDLYNICRDLRK